jgi:hypothetical protein
MAFDYVKRMLASLAACCWGQHLDAYLILLQVASNRSALCTGGEAYKIEPRDGLREDVDRLNCLVAQAACGRVLELL